jgi:putative transposase
LLYTQILDRPILDWLSGFPPLWASLLYVLAGQYERAGVLDELAEAVIQEAYFQGVSKRSVDELVKAMGMTGISKSQVSRLAGEIDERIHAFLDHPLEGDWPYLWIDATYVKVREARRIVSIAVIIAVAVNTDGGREVLGMRVGPSEAELSAQTPCAA